MTDFSLAAFEERARARLSPRVRPETLDSAFLPLYGDYRINPTDIDTDLLGRAKAAAVLIAAVERDGQAALILTERTPHLRAHSGQVAFPGGKIDPEDDGPVGAALREAEEEIGLTADRARPVGYLDPYITTSGYRIAPVVAVVDPAFEPAPNAEEVAHVFETPLAFLMDPARHERRSRPWQGKERFFYAMPYGDHYIWGVTAGIIRQLYERLYG